MLAKQKFKLTIYTFLGLTCFVLLLRYSNIRDKEAYENEQKQKTELCHAKYQALQKYYANGYPVKKSLKLLNKYFKIDSIYTDLVSLSENDTILLVFGYIQDRKLGKLSFRTSVSVNDSLKLSKISLSVIDSMGYQYLYVNKGKLIKEATSKIIEDHINKIHIDEEQRRVNLKLLKNNKFAVRFGMTETEYNKLKGRYSIEDVILAVTDGWSCYDKKPEFNSDGLLYIISCGEGGFRNNDGKFSKFYQLASMIDKTTKVRHKVVRFNNEHITYEWRYGVIGISLYGDSEANITWYGQRPLSVKLAIYKIH